MQIGLCFGDTYDEENFEFFDVEPGTPGIWNTHTISLSEHQGKTIKAISLKFSSDEDIANYKMNIGQFAIKDTNVNKVVATNKVTLDEVMFHNAYNAETRIYWDKVSDPNLAYYEIYRVRANGDREYVGMTPNNAYYISPFDRDGEEEKTEFEVVSVDKNYNRGEAGSVVIDWSLALGDTEKPSTEKTC